MQLKTILSKTVYVGYDYLLIAAHAINARSLNLIFNIRWHFKMHDFLEISKIHKNPYSGSMFATYLQSGRSAVAVANGDSGSCSSLHIACQTLEMFDHHDDDVCYDD